jgi:hypothetical protein
MPIPSEIIVFVGRFVVLTILLALIARATLPGTDLRTLVFASLMLSLAEGLTLLPAHGWVFYAVRAVLFAIDMAILRKVMDCSNYTAAIGAAIWTALVIAYNEFLVDRILRLLS